MLHSLPEPDDISVQITRILAVRHGETAWNRDTRIQGHTDIGLNAHGQAQARRLGIALREEPLAAIYASDLSRARATAEAVAVHHGLPVHTDPGLRERGFGHFEGLTWTEIEARHPEEALAWRKRHPSFTPPGGGESLLQLRQRIVAAVHALAARHTGQQIMIVAHGGVLDILYRDATRLELQAPRTWELTNTAVNRLIWSPEGLSLVGWADTSHLQDGSLDESAA